jgi:RIO kinase 1
MAENDEANYEDNYDEQTFERFNSKRKRKPQVKRSIGALTVSEAEAKAFSVHDEPPLFKDRGLQDLHERGYLDELLYQLKSGKEATVYAGKGLRGLVAVKVYADLQARSFRKDGIYREGRHIGDPRLQKAIDQRSRTGLSAQQALWVEEEYRKLQALHAAGIPVPVPYGQSGRAIAMEFIGDENGPAPRLSEVDLTRDEAWEVFDQCVQNLAHIVAIGLVHGDYSAFNILLWQGRAVVIDLPQVVEIESNRNAEKLLERDVGALCSSFSRFGTYPEPRRVLRHVMELSRESGLGNIAEAVQ